MGDFSDDYGGYDILGLYEQRDEERRAQRTKLLTPVRKTILQRKELQDEVAKIWSAAIESTYKDLIDASVLAEREACAAIAENVGNATEPDDFALDKCYEIEAAIRARGQA